jgi:serine/threonine protein kinase/tetratricopeptide (TPR) repeat protein
VIGQTVSHYKILEKIGSGGMGVVYKAEDTRIQLPVALKFLPVEMTGDERSKRRFVREAQAAFALDHPNICNIHEIDETEDGRLFICMSYYAGESLKERIARGPVPVEEAVRTVSSVATGLARAHGEGIVHRDIKPGNVFITREGEVKILDFGLAKLAGRSRVTRTGVSPGTVAYMSPEQATSNDIDARSDIFSLGVVLYELLTGRAPFEADHEAAVLYKILNVQPTPVREQRADCPRGLERVIDKALQKDIGDRYQTIAELQGDLERVLQGIAPTAKLSRPRLRSRPAIGLVAIALALVGLALSPPLKETIRTWLGSTGAPEELHVAVLPFENVGGDPTNQAFCDGMMETLTSKLTQLEQFHGSLWVVPASDVRKRGITSVAEAAGAFGVNLAITGSVQPIQEGVRLTMNLVSVASKTPRQLSSSVTDVRMMDIAMLQDKTVREMVGMLDVQLAPGAQEALAAGNTDVSQAFADYVRARGYLQRHEDPSNIDLAIDNFTRAIKQDPSYALAYAGLGEAYWLKYDATKNKTWIDPAIENCNRAAALNDELAPVHVSLGIIDDGTGRYEEAVTHFQRAIELDPASVAGYRGLARAYADLGRLDEAEATYRKAIETKPDYWAAHNDLGLFLYGQGRYRDAVEEFREVARLTPDNVWAYLNLGAAFWYLERWEEASKMFRRAIDIKPSRAAYNNLASVEYILGHYAEAAKMYLEALAIDNGRYGTWANLANSYYWAAGERDKADGAYRRAREIAEGQLKVNPRDANVLVDLASYNVMLGDDQAARARLEEALAIDSDDLFVEYAAAHTYEQLGERDKALEWIGKALAKGYPVGEITRDPFMQKLKEDERFEQLLADRGQ